MNTTSAHRAAPSQSEPGMYCRLDTIRSVSMLPNLVFADSVTGISGRVKSFHNGRSRDASRIRPSNPRCPGLTSRSSHMAGASHQPSSLNCLVGTYRGKLRLVCAEEADSMSRAAFQTCPHPAHALRSKRDALNKDAWAGGTTKCSHIDLTLRFCSYNEH